MKFIGGGWAGGGWEGGQYHPQGDKQQCCVFSKAQKLPVNLVGRDSSLTPQAALLVPISGPIDPVVDCRGFTGSAKDRL